MQQFWKHHHSPRTSEPFALCLSIPQTSFQLLTGGFQVIARHVPGLRQEDPPGKQKIHPATKGFRQPLSKLLKTGSRKTRFWSGHKRMGRWQFSGTLPARPNKESSRLSPSPQPPIEHPITTTSGADWPLFCATAAISAASPTTCKSECPLIRRPRPS